MQDDVIKVFNDSYEMKRHMQEFPSEWEEGYPIRNLVFYAPSNDEVVSPALVDTVQCGTGLTVDVGMNTYGIRKCALPSMFRRCGVSGDALNSVTKKELALILNTCGKTRRGKTKISVVDGKVSAFLSDDGNGLNYSILPSADVFRLTEEKIAELLGEDSDEFFGVWSFEGIKCRWKLPIKKYLEGEEYKIQLTLSTSDVGTGAVEYSAALVGKGVTIPLVNPCKVSHRLASQEEDISEVLEMMDAMINDGLRNIDDLKKITITNPVNTLKRVMKTVKLPQAKSLEVIEEYEASYAGGGDNACNLYLSASKVVNLYARSQPNVLYQNVVRNNVLKLLGIDWKKYDLPGTFSW